MTETRKSGFLYERNARMRMIRFNNGNLSQETAAAMIGFNAQYYSRVERGMNDGCVEFWRNFKKAFNISDSEIWAIMNNYPIETNKET